MREGGGTAHFRVQSIVRVSRQRLPSKAFLKRVPYNLSKSNRLFVGLDAESWSSSNAAVILYTMIPPDAHSLGSEGRLSLCYCSKAFHNELDGMLSTCCDERCLSLTY
ncbi:hypothetical protein Dsin_011859 [Dipteronia sinensis]|uniref:Uncharacterized protein n=1 Tax=Dipteronia sinensis TaxID=43782 RepID=A0AAE0AI80_9ROSI|nr:hypothetical protein Dsin_011859 [Dipteronia sinensis]